MSASVWRTPHQANIQNHRGPHFKREHYAPGQWDILTAFRAEEYIKDQIDVQPGHCWDSLTFDAGDVFRNGARMFKIPYSRPGDSGRIKTLADTSMSESEHFASPEAFAIRRVLFTFSKSSLAIDAYSIVEGFVWYLHMGRKPYLGSPLISLQTTELTAAPIRICDYCHSVWANDSTCPGCGARQFSLSTLGGGATAGLCFMMDLGKNTLVIEHGIRFWVDFTGEDYTLSAPLKMWCHFEGLHARGIQ